MAQIDLQPKGLRNPKKLERIPTNFFGWAFAVNGLFLFLFLFPLFALSLISLQWARVFFQFTEKIYIEEVGYVVAFAVGLFFAVRWEVKKVQPDELERYRYWLQVVIRYVLAYVFLEYGFAKIFKGQFRTNLSTLDVPLGEISGFQLAWRFFGYSYAYTLFIAASQLLSAMLLFFRRTTLLAAAILAPTIVNIVVVNFTHQINIEGEAVSLMLLVFYLLFVDFRRLNALFWEHSDIAKHHFPTYWTRRALRYARYFVIVFFILFSFGENYKAYDSYEKTTTPLYGAWEVENYQVNGAYRVPEADPVVWKKVYFESDRRVSIKTNKKRPREFESDVTLDLNNKTFKLTDSYTNDLFIEGSYEVQGLDKLLISASDGKDTIQVTLRKIK